MKYYKTYSESLTMSSLPKLGLHASMLDFSRSSTHTLSSKNLEALEGQAQNLVTHSNLFTSAACQSLSSEDMDSALLDRFLQAVAKSLCHSVALSVLLAMDLQQVRRNVEISTSKTLTDLSKDNLKKVPVGFDTPEEKSKEIYKENFETEQRRFLAQAAAAQKPLNQSQNKRSKPNKKTPKPQTRGGFRGAHSGSGRRGKFSSPRGASG